MGSWLWGIVLALLVIIGGIAATQTDALKRQDRDGYSDTVVGSMMVYRNKVVEYATSHPTAVGQIADSALALPAWFNKVSDVKNYVEGGRGYVYYAASMDGQAYEMLQESEGDMLVGINKSGKLYNPSGGLTTITLPTAIPDGAVVYAPAALSTAPPPSPPGSPANCSLATGTTRSWTVSGRTCSSRTTAAVTVTHNATRSFSDNLTVNSGTAAFLCSNGTLSTTAYPGATCNPPPPANCTVAGGTTRSWAVSGNTCAGPHAAATVTHGSSLTFTSTNGNDGAAGFVCNNGTLSTTPDGSQTCTVPPAPCTLPSPSTQTNTETRTATQTLACSAGYSGSITQTQPQQRTQTRSAYCPAPTGAYSWGSWSAWSAWTATGPWTTTSNTCVANCVVPSPSTESRTVACPAGYTGSITEQRSASCPAATGSPVWSSWTETSRTCASAYATSTDIVCTKSYRNGWPDSAKRIIGYFSVGDTDSATSPKRIFANPGQWTVQWVGLPVGGARNVPAHPFTNPTFNSLRVDGQYCGGNTEWGYQATVRHVPTNQTYTSTFTCRCTNLGN